MTIANGSLPDSNDVLNVFHHGGNVIIGQNGNIRVPIIINNASGVRNVYLHLWGYKTGYVTGFINHGVPEHTHTATTDASSGASSATVTINNAGTNIVADTSVPAGLQIGIDGTNFTNTIGDPNSKGASIFGEYTYDTDAAQQLADGSLTTFYTETFNDQGVLLKEVTFTVTDGGGGGSALARVIYTYDDATTATTTTETTAGTKTAANPNLTKPVVSVAFQEGDTGTGTWYVTPQNITTYQGWGTDGTTEWSSGVLNITSVISWTAGEHYVDLFLPRKTFGNLVYHVSVNVGYET